MTIKKALITGITGQDGSYLAEILIEKGYEVHGLKRRASSLNSARIDHIYEDPHNSTPRLILHYGDMSDAGHLHRLVAMIQPDEIYNLAAQSHVAVSFEAPEYTSNIDALGAVRLLDAIRLAGIERTCRFFQASTSEMFGSVSQSPQTEETPFHPRSPYAVAKLYAHWITVNYREAHGLFACNGIMFNHESPRRGETFVTRKITRGLAALAYGYDSCIYLGNLDAKRDWGHARDTMEAVFKMMQLDQPRDLIIATGESYSVREFLLKCTEYLGLVIEFRGKGIDEQVIAKKVNQDMTPEIKPGQILVKIDSRYIRPSEVDSLQGDASQAMKALNWKPKVSFSDLCVEMMESDLISIRQKAVLKQHGYD